MKNDKSIYILKKLSGLYLAGIFISDKLERFHTLQQLYPDCTFNFILEKILTLDEFLVGNYNDNFSDIIKDFLILYCVFLLDKHKKLLKTYI